jgi:hypothetical protein
MFPVCFLEIMKPFSAEYFIRLAHELTDRANRAMASQFRSEGVEVGPLVSLLDDMIGECESAGLHVSGDSLRKIKQSVRDGMTFAELGIHWYHFVSTMQSEMKLVRFLQLEGDEPAYFDVRKPAWGTASTRFPDIIDDAGEGGKCFALGRYTAAVFHMMRVLEIGLTALSDEVGATTKRPDWHNVVTEIENRIAAISTTQPLPPDWKAKAHFYAGLALHFRFLKDAWRNYVAHAKETYDAGTALSVLTHVSEFMQQLAKDRPWKA